MNFGPHAHFIWTCYAVVAFAVAVMSAWLIWDGKRLARLHKDLEKRGLTRRSKQTTSTEKT